MSSSPEAMKAFESYIKDKKIVIADPSSVSRAAVAQSMAKLGAKSSDMALVTTYQLAEEAIAKLKPRIVICDYDLGKRCGLDLIQRQKAQMPDVKDSLFILVTGNTSQTAVARAAEEDVDTFLIKPFSAEQLKNSVLRVAMLKLYPPPYLVEVEKGKIQLMQGKADEAIKILEHAKTLDKAPSLACFYLGQAQVLKKMIDGAEGEYSEGLEFNKIHYKCMVGMYELLAEQKKHKEAYDVIRKIAQYFPANPQRLTAVLRLAIMTGSYEDVERYYQIFTTIDDRNEEIIRYICAALVVCGKHYITNNASRTRAMELFSKAAATGAGRVKILREIITTLVDANLPKQAEEFLRKFPSDIQSGPDFQTMELLVMNKTKDTGVVLDRARTLITRDIHEPVIYQILIKRSVEAKFNDSAEDFAQKAAKRWPEQKASFDALLPKK